VAERDNRVTKNQEPSRDDYTGIRLPSAGPVILLPPANQKVQNSDNTHAEQTSVIPQRRQHTSGDQAANNQKVTQEPRKSTDDYSDLRTPSTGPVILLPPANHKVQTTNTPHPEPASSIPHPRENTSPNTGADDLKTKIDFDKSLEAATKVRDNFRSSNDKSIQELSRINTMYPALSPSGRYLVFADTQRDAETIALRVDKLERDISLRWTGEEPSLNREPRVLIADITEGSATGLTSFNRHGIQNQIYTTLEGPIGKIIEDVLPHEICHIVLTERLGRIPPRWADEGMSTLVESQKTISLFESKMLEKLRPTTIEDGESTSEAIKTNRLFQLTDYPTNSELTLYFQGTSIAKYLVEKENNSDTLSGERKFFNFIEDVMRRERNGEINYWSNSVSMHYGFYNLQKLQDAWLEWLKEKQGKET